MEALHPPAHVLHVCRPASRCVMRTLMTVAAVGESEAAVETSVEKPAVKKQRYSHDSLDALRVVVVGRRSRKRERVKMTNGRSREVL